MSPHKTFLLSLTMLAVFLPTGAFAGGIPIPSDYIGEWAYTSTTRDCVTQAIINQSAGRDTVCAGDTFDPSAGQYPIDCTGTADGTTIDLHCTGSFQKDPECLVNVTYEVDGTRNGVLWNTTTRVEFEFVGSSCPIAEFCTETQSSSKLVDPDPECAQSPVDPASWGRIKHQYMD